jgi:hypothetical protein
MFLPGGTFGKEKPGKPDKGGSSKDAGKTDKGGGDGGKTEKKGEGGPML